MSKFIFNDKNIKSQRLVIDLEFVIDYKNEKISNRKYYLLNYKDNTHKLFYTTNELDNPEPNIVKTLQEFGFRGCEIDNYIKEKEYLAIIDEEYSEIENFKQLLNGFENSNFLNYHLNNGFNTPPKYIYYNINFIDNEFKPMFLKHLKENTSQYIKGDLSKDEEFNIDNWTEYLNS